MNFTTASFAVLLTVVFVLHWSLRTVRSRNVLLLVASYFFYGWWDVRFLALMWATGTIDWAVAAMLDRTGSPGARKRLLCVSLGCNLTVLGAFKYFNFFADSLVSVGAFFGVEISPVTIHVILPVGISFYTFQAMAYVIDVYRREIRACRDYLDFLTFVAYFPQLVAGPIERAGHLLPQIRNPRVFDAALARDGLREMLWGFFKKMVVAESLALVADHVYASPGTASGPSLVIGTVAFSLQIYCDFSAYSSIARGASALLGVRLSRNFLYPYFSRSMTEFWRRWHVSLSSWFRDYLYIPLGGGRVGMARRVFNVMAVFLISGLWHGASWNYVAWGGLNGLLVLPAILGLSKGGSLRPEGAPRTPLMVLGDFARIVGVFVATCACWVFFRSPTLHDAIHVFGKIATDSWSVQSWREAWAHVGELSPWRGGTGSALAMVLEWLTRGWGVVVVLVEWFTRGREHPLQAIARWPTAVRWLIYGVLVWCVLVWGMNASSAFIYFRF
ncbi:MAG: MBOAT family O-acyltransferase [Planctomycetota bacterium]